MCYKIVIIASIYYNLFISPPPFLRLLISCPWVNNCIGINNQKFFILFVFWTFFSCAVAIVMIFARFMVCYHRTGFNNKGIDYCNDPRSYPFGLILTIESFLFAIFTFIMLMEQYTSISSNTTKISRLKLLAKPHVNSDDLDSSRGFLGENIDDGDNFKSVESNNDNEYDDAKLHKGGSDKSASIEINELIGAPSSIKFRWIWLLPISFEFSKPIRDKIYGYKSPLATQTDS